jgi:hypothetical protein
MGDSISDILGARGLSEPPEIKIIKDFVHNEVGLTPDVRVTSTSFIVSVSSAAAAGTLRFKLFQLQRQLGNQRKIILKIH